MAGQCDAAQLQGLDALYLRWWAVIGSAALADGKGALDIADAVDLLEIPVIDFWPFLEWASRCRKCHFVLGGRDGLGRMFVN